MKDTGITRKVDELGRIVLPIELRRSLDIEEKDTLEIYVEDEVIMLKKRRQTCIFCAGTRELTNYMGKNICRECIKKVAVLD